MKFNLIKTREEIIREIENMPPKSEILINICNRQVSISTYSSKGHTIWSKGYTIWWGGNYGIDCEDAHDVVDKLEFLTSFVSEGEFNKYECYITRETLREMKENKYA